MLNLAINSYDDCTNFLQACNLDLSIYHRDIDSTLQLVDRANLHISIIYLDHQILYSMLHRILFQKMSQVHLKSSPTPVHRFHS